jgi:signal peptidase
MQPTLDVGDLLVIQDRSAENILIGDIIIFLTQWHRDSPVVHRVVGIIEDEFGNQFFVTKGDNNPIEDKGLRTIDDILGVAILRIPVLGHVSLYLHTLEGIVALGVIITTLLVVPELIERRRYRTSEFQHFLKP